MDYFEGKLHLNLLFKKNVQHSCFFKKPKSSTFKITFFHISKQANKKVYTNITEG